MINITTKNKILSIALGGLTAAVPAAVYLIDRTALEGTFNTAMNALAVFSKFNNFIYGMFDLAAVIYFITVTLLFVFFTVQAIEKRRWS